MRTYHELPGEDRSQLGAQVGAQRERIRERLAAVRWVLAVMSGKGGVGKSFVTAALASTLARRGRRVGVLDADLHGPSAARMLGVVAGRLDVRDDGVVPAVGAGGVRVMSTDLLLPEGAPLTWREPKHEGFVWRGTLEAGMLREFLGDVAWGELDMLLVDLPPGTERFAALVEFVPALAGVVIVTIPSDASRRAVMRSVEVARTAGAPILGIVENMAGYQCGACGSVAPLFRGDAASALAAASGAPVLASILFDADGAAGTDGEFARTGRMAAAFSDLTDALLNRLESR
jgi:ATP-binding protein involved in chromosome partitioning